MVIISYKLLLQGDDIILKYIHFLVKCSKNQFHFFNYTPLKKAQVLAHHNLSFLAGLYYLDLKEYKEAAHCFEKCNAHKHLMVTYQKQGLYSKAIEIAEHKHYYKSGAKMCMHIHNIKKAAFFYAYFSPSYAAKLYRNEGFFYEAAFCYLKAYEPLSAIDCYKAIKDSKKQQEVFKVISEFALVLYFTKQYEDAFKLFIAMDDYYSALVCAETMKEPQLVASTRLLIACKEANQGRFDFAAQCIEAYLPHKACFYYACSGNTKNLIRLLIETEDYDKAINVCLSDNNLNLAYEIASKYPTSRLSS